MALVASPDDTAVADAFDQGYRGVLRPSDGIEALERAFRAILAGRRWPPGAEALAANGSPTVRLTAREIQVFALLKLGLPNKRIASRLGVSERAVKFHVTSLLRKYGAKDRLGLVIQSHHPSPA